MSKKDSNVISTEMMAVFILTKTLHNTGILSDNEVKRFIMDFFSISSHMEKGIKEDIGEEEAVSFKDKNMLFMTMLLSIVEKDQLLKSLNLSDKDIAEIEAKIKRRL